MQKKFFIIFSLSMILFSCNTNKNIVQQQEEIALDAEMLYYYFSNNETEAIEKYVEKELLIEGKIVEFYKNFAGNSIVILAQNENFNGVECIFPLDFEILTPFKKGETLKLKGVCTEYKTNVIISDCQIIN